MSKLPAIPTAESINATLPPHIAEGLQVMLDAWTDAPSWPARMCLADVTLTMWVFQPATRFRTDSGSRLLTALLEQLGEREIRCAEAAALYGVSSHEQWRLASCRWFAAHEAELTALIERHPVWAVFAAQCAVLHA